MRHKLCLYFSSFNPWQIELDICKTAKAVGNPLCFRAQNLRVKLFPFSSAQFQKENLLKSYQFSDSNVNFHILQPNSWISMESFLYVIENSGINLRYTLCCRFDLTSKAVRTHIYIVLKPTICFSPFSLYLFRYNL